MGKVYRSKSLYEIDAIVTDAKTGKALSYFVHEIGKEGHRQQVSAFTFDSQFEEVNEHDSNQNR